MNIFKFIWNYLNPDSIQNIDRRIDTLRKEIVNHHFVPSEVLKLEATIHVTKDDNEKLLLKIKLRDKLKTIYNQHIYPDYIDRGW